MKKIPIGSDAETEAGREEHLGGKGLSKSLEIKSGSIKVLYIWTDLFACLVCIKIITSFPDAM